MSVEIFLPSGHITVIDEDDFDRIARFRWHRTSCGHVWRCVPERGRNAREFLHRFIMQPLENQVVHHKNENPLDNRKVNLVVTDDVSHGYYHRVVEYPKIHKNCQYKGVHYETARKRWKAMIYLPGDKPVFLGRFSTPEEAAVAYDRAALETFGPLAYTNLLKGSG